MVDHLQMGKDLKNKNKRGKKIYRHDGALDFALIANVSSNKWINYLSLITDCIQKMKQLPSEANLEMCIFCKSQQEPTPLVANQIV